jgi:tetratricopeptide (TPR) repeat protein
LVLVKKVSVGSFENRTGDASNDKYALELADRVKQGLAHVGIIQVVTTPEAADAVVGGAIDKHGSALAFRAQATRRRDASVLTTAGPVASAGGSAQEAIEKLAQQVTAHIACFADPQLAPYAHRITLPSNYEAYRELSMAGQSHTSADWERALAHEKAAAQLDPSLLAAVTIQIVANRNLGRPDAAAEVIRQLAPVLSAMTPFERATVEVEDAGLRGDRAAAYRASKRIAELVPNGAAYVHRAATEAMAVNRPAEANEWLLQIDRTAADSRDFVPYWSTLTAALHMIPRHDQELRETHEGRRQYPSSLAALWFETRAVIALGRLDEVKSRLREASSLRPANTYTPGGVLRQAGEELRAHGHDAEGRVAFEESEAWYRGRPASEAGREAFRYELAQSLARLDRWSDAEMLLSALNKEFPANVDYLGQLGATAARQGRKDEAKRISVRLRDVDRPYLIGLHTLWRARISAALGEREQALSLLREAFAQGQRYGLWLHADVFFEALRNDQGFRELLEPKG